METLAMFKFVSVQGYFTFFCAIVAIACMAYPFDLTSKGLILNIAGVVIAFFYGLPHPPYDDVGVIGLEDATPDKDGGTIGQRRKIGAALKKLHIASAYLGLIYMFAGFCLQLIDQLQK